MSTEKTNTELDEDVEKPSEINNRDQTYQNKRAVHERDQRQCICCRKTFEDIGNLDAHHIVPEGKAGPDTIRNKGSLCRQCHEAVHGERDHAPTIRCTSTGDMTEDEFSLYRQFWTEQLPALSSVVLEHRLTPKIGIASAPYTAWHVPAGELRRLDEVLATMDVVYAPLDN